MTDIAAIDQARRLLDAAAPSASTRTDSPWTALAAAGLAAFAAVLMAGVMVLGPGVVLADRPAAVSNAGD